ncbi:MAG TPA: hypothetical protein VIV61_11880 [Candidatus Ozemobacteraceae bacterium]
MWVGLFFFCLFLLFLGFFLYGLDQWDQLFAAPDETAAPTEEAHPPQDRPGQRAALWFLVIGLGVIAVMTDLSEFLSRPFS